jgi:plastocyanin
MPEPKPVATFGAVGVPAGGIPREDLVVDGQGNVHWAFVYIRKGLEGKTFEPPTTPVVMEQRGMIYRPHVVGVQIGQRLEIVNRDKQVHNVHSFTHLSLFGAPQPDLTVPWRGVFPKAEVMAQIRCDIHPWMRAWIGVVNHPYFAVTDVDGTFEIRDLPPGRYTLSLWHEKLEADDQIFNLVSGWTAEFVCRRKE